MDWRQYIHADPEILLGKPVVKGMRLSVELLLNAVNLNFLAFANYLDPAGIKGQVFAVFVITVAAAEAAVGLAIVLAIYCNRDTIDMERFNLLKW